MVWRRSVYANPIPAIMKKYIYSFIFIFVVHILYSQEHDFGFTVGKIISDTSTLSDDYYKYEFPSIMNSKNKIEIRFISSTLRINSSYLILSYYEHWDIKFQYYEIRTKDFKNKKLNCHVNLDSLFSKLVSFNIFSIPDQKAIKPEMKFYNPKVDLFVEKEIMVNDGGCTAIEFKIGNYYRRYTYCNCSDYQESFPLMHEYSDYHKVENLFYDIELK
jgi:hypothetical protein